MGKRKDKASKKGFQIPIEDGDVKDAAKKKDEAVEDSAAGEAKGSQAEVEAEAAAEAAAEAPAEASESEAAAETEAEAATAAEKETEADPESEAEGEQAGEDDLVAEAEAIVEEASAADQLEEAQKQAQDWQDRYMRLHAEWDTYRRRTSEQRAEEKIRATEKLVEDLLPVLDDFERSIAYATENGETGLLEGVKAVQTKLLDSLKKSGLVVIDPAGEAYDALEAQAVATVADDEAFDETVRDVYQKGYKMGKKVLRPAMVTVTTGGPKRPAENSD